MVAWKRIGDRCVTGAGGASDRWSLRRLQCKGKGGKRFVAARSQLQWRGVGGWSWGVVVDVLG